MNQYLEQAIPAIITRIRARRGGATKTKVLKLLYLLDVEFYRDRKAILSEFDWIFYKYGPWVQTYDGVLSELSAGGRIAIQLLEGADTDAMLLDVTRPLELSAVFPNIRDEYRSRAIIDNWAEKPTGELLDYVYFHTAPMRNAERNQPLRFDAVLEGEPTLDYQRTQSGTTPEALKKLRNEFRKALDAEPKSPEPFYVEPSYGKEYWEAISTMEREPD